MTALIELIRQYQNATNLELRIRVLEDIAKVLATPLQLFIAGKMDQDGMDDVFQETLTGVFTSLDRFQGEADSQAWGWCYTIARHKLADHFRKQGRDRLELMAPNDLWQAVEASAKDAPISPEAMERLEYAMDRLKEANPPCYDYLWSRYMLGFDNKMMAEVFGLNYGSVHTIIKRCLDTARS